MTIKNIFTLIILLAAFLGTAAYLSIPSARISPADGSSEIVIGQGLRIDASPLASIGKVAVYADGELVDIEYNLGTGELRRELMFKPGQEIRVETKVASAIGLTRELTSTFKAVEPLIVEKVLVDGEELTPGAKMAPRSDLAFHFNKPVENAEVIVDNGETFVLWADREDPNVAVLKSFYPLKQGATHSFRMTAAARDSATLEQELLIDVVRPLSFYGEVASDGDGIKVELYGSVPFDDPGALQEAFESDLPAMQISVQAQKIVITCSDPDPSRGYFLSLAGAQGRDGSYLELPLELGLDMNAGQTQFVSSSGTTTGNSYSGGNNAAGRAPSGSVVGSGPPPGWPPCCPWPPE